MARTWIAGGYRWCPAMFVLFLLVLTGCEETGSVNKPATVPTSELGEVDDSMPKPGFISAPPAESPIEPPRPSDGAATAFNPTPEQFLTAFKFRPSHGITDNDLARIASMAPANSEIVELDLKGARITKDGLAQLAHLPNLRSVNLTGCQILGAEWGGISTATQLENLILEKAAVNDASLAAIAPLVNLKALNLNHTRVTDAGFLHLTNLSRLQTISCDSLVITGAGFEVLTGMYAGAPLTEINVNNTNFAAFGFQHIAGMKSLQVLIAGNAGVNDQALQALKDMKELRVLNLANNKITDQAMSILDGMNQLEELDLGGNAQVSNFTLEKLRNHMNLTKLRVESTMCSLAGVQELKQILPDCTIHFAGMEY